MVVISKRSVLSTTGWRRGSSTARRTRTTAASKSRPADRHVADDRSRREPGGGVAVDGDDDRAAEAGDRQPDGQSEDELR